MFVNDKGGDEEGESPAIEVFEYKDPNGYFASELKAC